MTERHCFRGLITGLLLVGLAGASVAQTNTDLAAMSAARQKQAEILSQRHDLNDERVRGEVVRQLQEAQEAQEAVVRRRANARGLALEGDKPGGGRFQLVDFDENDQPVYDQTENVNAAISTAAHQVRATAPYHVTGANIRIGLWEAGGVPLNTHQELTTNRVSIFDTTTVSDHATHVAGTLAATGINSSTRGMVPAATLTCRNSANDAAEMTAAGAAAPNSTKIYLSNHSYGANAGWEGSLWTGAFTDDGNSTNDVDPDFGRYAPNAASWDGIAYNLPYYLIFISAGNHRNDAAPGIGGAWSAGGTNYTYDPTQHPKGDGVYKLGYDNMEGRKVAKNVMTVGAVNDAVSGGNRNLGSASIASFSSWGPTDDGRIKPDIMANGSSLISCGSLDDTDTYSSSGTSMSSPNACGSAALLIDYYGVRFPGGAMRASTLKTLILHTADDLGGAGPDYQTGWGLMNTKAAAEVIRQHADNTGGAAMIESAVSTGITSRTFTNGWDGTKPLRVTLGWTDPAAPEMTGNDNRTKVLVNDLNLTVTRVGGPTHYPYVMPYVGAWTTNLLGAAAVTGVNTVDNTEQVYLAGPAAGEYLITVNYTGALSGGIQNYSLIISGQTNSIGGATNTWDNYTEIFDGAGSSLSGKTTSTGGGIWSANSIVTDNGVLTANAGSAILPFNPVPNRIYTLSLKLNYVGATAWLGLGFTTVSAVVTPGGSATGDRFSNANVPGYAWFNYLNTGVGGVYEGSRATSPIPFVDPGFLANRTLSVVLDTTGDGSAFTADFRVDGSSITSGPQPVDTVTVAGINGVGFSLYGAGMAGSTVDDFALTSVSSIPSEPPTLNYTHASGDLVFSWTGSGFKLQMQTNNSLTIGLSTNWVDVPGGDTSGVSVPVTTSPTAFFRLVSPP
jgi:hypothetical protein